MSTSELKRIKEVYDKRNQNVPSQRYSFFDPAHLFIVQQRDWEIINALKKHKINNISDKRILDVGCGTGTELGNLVRYGAQPVNLYGIDFLHERIEKATQLHPNIKFECGDASNLPYEDNNFDIVIQFTVFSSIIENQMKANIAREMLRVLNPDGVIIWFDYYLNNPRNPDLKRITKSDIHELFPGCSISLKKIILAPPISRIITPYSRLFCCVLETLTIFNTIYLGVISKI